MINIVKAADYKTLSKQAAVYIGAQLLSKPHSVLGLATGGTPEGTYQELVNMYTNKIIDFSRAVTFNLDEYWRLDPDHPQSYHSYMYRHLFSRINIQAGNIHIPNGMSDNPYKECGFYERSIMEAGGIDLQLLGIGRNGHIGFNEPAQSFTNGTTLVNLTEDTIQANSRYFNHADQVPKQALSMGVGTIMQAKCILLIASGADKKDALEKMLSEPATPKLPASILQFHPNVTLLYCD